MSSNEANARGENTLYTNTTTFIATRHTNVMSTLPFKQDHPTNNVSNSTTSMYYMLHPAKCLHTKRPSTNATSNANNRGL